VKKEDPGFANGFGSVALDGDTVVVSAPHDGSAATGIDGDQNNTGFGGTIVAVHAFGSHVEDVNSDDIFDMVFHFNTQDTGITCDDFRAVLSSETFGGEAFTGTNSVKTASSQ